MRDVEVTELKRLGTPTRGRDRTLLVMLNSATKYVMLKQVNMLRFARDQTVTNIKNR